MQKENETAFVPVAKSLNPVYKQALYVVLEPDTVDAHGDIYDAETVMKACHSFNRANPPANLYHRENTDKFSVVESFIAPVPMIINGEVVKSGSWLANLEFTDELWDDVLNDKFSGVSISAIAEFENLE